MVQRNSRGERSIIRKKTSINISMQEFASLTQYDKIFFEFLGYCYKICSRRNRYTMKKDKIVAPIEVRNSLTPTP